MIRVALWIVGPPAAGKTTLARTLLSFDACSVLGTVKLIERPKWTVCLDGLAVGAGHYTGHTFDGADRVPYNGVRPALEYWLDHLRERAALTVFDGDRFSHRSAVDFVRPHVDRVEVRYIDATPDELEARRTARGWAANPQWLKGRETKAKRFAELFK